MILGTFARKHIPSKSIGLAIIEKRMSAPSRRCMRAKSISLSGDALYLPNRNNSYYCCRQHHWCPSYNCACDLQFSPLFNTMWMTFQSTLHQHNKVSTIDNMLSDPRCAEYMSFPHDERLQGGGGYCLAWDLTFSATLGTHLFSGSSSAN